MDTMMLEEAAGCLQPEQSTVTWLQLVAKELPSVPTKFLEKLSGWGASVGPGTAPVPGNLAAFMGKGAGTPQNPLGRGSWELLLHLPGSWLELPIDSAAAFLPGHC